MMTPWREIYQTRTAAALRFVHAHHIRAVPRACSRFPSMTSRSTPTVKSPSEFLLTVDDCKRTTVHVNEITANHSP
jgi:hypothetical protein